LGLALAGAIFSASARAERWTLDPSVTSRATWTDNSAFDDQGQASADTLIELVPSISLLGDGKRFRVRGSASLTALTYVNGTRGDRLLPTVDLTANLEAIERFFFIEAGVVTRQTAEDAFAPRPDGAADVNTVTTSQYRLVPSFEGRLGGDVQYRLRSSNSWTDTRGGTGTSADGAYSGEHVLRVERAPTPFGWATELSRSDTLFESGLAARSTLDSARLVLSYALSPTTNFGLRGGYEQLRIRSAGQEVDNHKQAVYGLDLHWRPTERTELNALWEDRFFGSAWHFKFDHRMPRVAWNVSLSRDITSLPQSFLTLPATNNVAALLDAAFTTRFPDPAERARIVADLIARQGLPSSLATQTSLFAERVSIVTSGNASIAFIGVRNSLAISAFSSKTEDLPDSIFANVPGNSLNVLQHGGSLTVSQQATTLTALNLTAAYTRTKGLAADEGLQSTQKIVRIQMTRQLSAKSSAFIGARLQRFDSKAPVPNVNTPGARDTPANAREHAAFIGLSHRF
jgi:uncharacterized protein (PEP-CTERM system associated)